MLRKMRFWLPAAAVAVLLVIAGCRAAEPTAVPPTAVPPPTAVAVVPTTAPEPAMMGAYMAPSAPANELDWVPKELIGIMDQYPGRMIWYTQLPLPTTEPRYGGRIVRTGSAGHGGAMRHWDWTTSNNPIGTGMSGCLGRFMVFHQDRYAAAEDPRNVVTYKASPDLFVSWKNTDDLTWEFKVSQDVYWHDSPLHPSADGSRVTAEDAKFSLEYIRDSTIFGGTFQIISDVIIEDPQTIIVKTSKPYSFLPEILSSATAGLIKRDHLESEAGLKTWCVGTGPFKLAAWHDDQTWSLDRNEKYHLKGHSGLKLPYIDGIDVVTLADQATGVAAMMTGKIHLMTNDNMANLVSMLNESDSIEGLMMPMAPGWQAHFAWNLTKAPFNDVRVRRAVAMGIDHQALIDTAWGGIANISGQIPFDAMGWDTFPPVDQRSEWYQFNPTKAKELLAEAGYPNGFNVDYKFNPGSGGWGAQMEMIIFQLENIGVTLDVNQMEYLQRYTDLTAKNYDGLIQGSGIPSTNWDAYTFGWMNSNSKTNFFYIDDPEVDRITEAARGTFDRAGQQKLFTELFELSDENLYRLNLTTPYYFSIWQNYMENVSSGQAWVTAWATRENDRIWFEQGYPQ